MSKHNIDEVIEAYNQTPNLKVVGERLSIPWQSVYVILKENGVSVVGDKKQYGADTDKLARKAEEAFNKIVDYAIDKNKDEFQAKYDFDVGSVKVDIKASTKKVGNRRSKTANKYLRWAFGVKVQSDVADFLV